MDKAVVLQKLDSLRRCLQRVRDKTPSTAEVLATDVDAQDILVLNLERAVQICVDIGLHIISYLDGPVPESMAETFLFLQKAGYLSEEVAGRMVKAVGFRNTAVHAYQSIDWNIVFRIGTLHLTDFQDFARQILARLD